MDLTVTFSLDSDDRPNKFGRLLQELRMHRGISQGALARFTGVTPGYISRIESGQRIPTLGVVDRFARVLDIPPEDRRYSKLMEYARFTVVYDENQFACREIAEFDQEFQRLNVQTQEIAKVMLMSILDGLVELSQS